MQHIVRDTKSILRKKISMKTFIKTIVGMQYNELSEDAKEKAKADYLEYGRFPQEFSMDLVENLKASYELHNLKTYYSLSYCQGDGLCLYGEISHSEIFNNNFRKIALKGLKGRQITSVKENLYKIDFRHSGSYYYANSTDIEAQENSYDITDKQYALLEKVVTNIREWYLEFCREWEDIGYDYFYEISNEEMEGVSEANDYYYDENGVLLDTAGLSEVA